MAIPYLIGRAIDTYITPGDIQGLNRIALLTAGLLLGCISHQRLQQYLLSRTGQKVLATMRTSLVEHLQHIHLGYHDTHIIGVTISRVFSDVGVINELLSQGFITLIGDIITLVGIITIMLVQQYPVGIV